jgi:hypothetical protein
MANISINQDSLKERREWKRHKINDGSNIYRILPPFGDSEQHNGYPYRKWSYIWLLDPVTGKRKPFASPFSYGEDKCPVKEYADALAKKVEGIVSSLKASGKSDDQIKRDPTLVAIREVQWKLKLTHSYSYNAADKSGEVGILEIKSTAHKGLCKKMSEYIKDYVQDPTSLNDFDDDSGVWFNFKREGKGKSTEYSVDFNTTLVKVEGSKRPQMELDFSPLPDAIKENYDDLGYDLHSLYAQKSYDELKEILVANVELLATDDDNPVPELIIEGFGDAVVDSVPAEEPVANTGRKTGKKPVALKVDVEEDAEPLAKVTAGADNEDFMAMASSILDS